MAIASLVLGILSLISFFPLFALIGLVLGIKANKKLKEQNQPSGIALSGIITSSIGLIISCFITLLLIAVAVPKFSNALNKARVSEAPTILAQIASAEAVWDAETGYYCIPLSDRAITDSLGVNTESEYFEYSIEASGKGFIAKATLIQKMGRASIGEYIWIDQDGSKGVEGYGIKALLPYYWDNNSYNSYY